MAVIMKISVLWDVPLCILVKFYWCVGSLLSHSSR